MSIKRHSDHYADSEPASWLPNINAKHQTEKNKPHSFYVFGVTRWGIETRTPAPLADALTTRLWERSLLHMEL